MRCVTFNVFKKIKEMIGPYNNESNKLVHKNGQVIIHKEERLKEWKKYTEILFNNIRPVKQAFQGQTGTQIVIKEVEEAIITAKTESQQDLTKYRWKFLKYWG